MNSKKRKNTGKSKNKKIVKRKLQFRGYSEGSLKKALEAVTKGISLRSSSKKFKVPFSTLRDKYKGKNEIGAKSGPPTILTLSEEGHLVHWIGLLSKRGFPVSKTMLLDSVQLFLKKDERRHFFTNGRPGRHWFEGFQKRHPELSIKKPRNLCQRRAALTEKQLRQWFQETENYLREKDLFNIDPSRVFNCDESAFMLHPPESNVIVPKNSKHVYNVVGSNDKECLTVLITGNAAGQMPPPMVMYSYQRLPAIIFENAPAGWGIGRSDNGWMTGESFYEYMTNVFYPWCVENKIQFPLIMYFDGHSSHATLALSDFCVEHKIELILLYPNSTHISQPMDVAIFKPLKDAWKTSVTKWRMEHAGASLNKCHFAAVLKNALDSINIEEKLSNGFTTCGLSPFNADAVHYELLLEDDESKEVLSSSLVEEKDYDTTCQRTLSFIENAVDETILQLFKSTEQENSNWKGDEQYNYFFKLWQQCYSQLKTKSNHVNVKGKETVMEPDVTSNNETTDIDPAINHGKDGSFVELSVNNDVFVEVIDVNGNPEALNDSSFEDAQIISFEDIQNNKQLNNIVLCNEIPKSVSLQQLNEKTHDNEVCKMNEKFIECIIDANNCTKNHGPFDNSIPGAFKDALFWPEDLSGKKKKVTIKQKKLPSVATSDAWRKFHKEKQEEKRKLEEEKEIRKKIKIENALIKKEETEKKKIIKKEQREVKIKMEMKKKEAKIKIKEEKAKVKTEKVALNNLSKKKNNSCNLITK